METNELIGVRCIAQRPTGSRTTEVINYDDLIKFLEKVQEFDVINDIKNNIKFNSKGRATFVSGVGYDIISCDLLSNGDYLSSKARDLFDKHGIDFVSVSKNASLKTTNEFHKYRKEMLKI